MIGIMDRADQAISVTEVSRAAKPVFDKLASGAQDKYVVLRNNAPAAVILSVAKFQELMDHMVDLEVAAMAQARLQESHPEKAITHADMLRRFGVQ